MTELHFQEIVRLDGFGKDMKALSRRFGSLPQDLQIFTSAALMLYHKVGGAYAEALAIYQIPGLGFSNPKLYKATKFACKSLKGKARDRVSV